jgi:hypothetical protein
MPTPAAGLKHFVGVTTDSHPAASVDGRRHYVNGHNHGLVKMKAATGMKLTIYYTA